MPTIDQFKQFLDETADKLGGLKSNEISGLYGNLVEAVLAQDSSEIIEEILAFCSASVLEMIQSAKGSLKRIFEARESLKFYSNFHVLISSVVSTVVKNPISDFEEAWIDLLLESVISGLTAIESETISLSGSSLIKLLKWEQEHDTNDAYNNHNTHETYAKCYFNLSRKLANHPDFVAILTADMCAMFSRIEEVDSAPFLRIVRFCELLIDVSDAKSGLKDKIVETVEKEFISKVYRTTLKTVSSKTLPLKWSNELLKVCHRGNELVKPLVGEVFKEIRNIFEFINVSDFIEILANERSRKIPEIVKLLFTFEESDSALTISNDDAMVIDEELYKETLLKQLESFEMFRITCFDDFKSITPLASLIFKEHGQILLNWLPYVLKVKVKIESESDILRLHMDISKKLCEFLDL